MQWKGRKFSFTKAIKEIFNNKGTSQKNFKTYKKENLKKIPKKEILIKILKKEILKKILKKFPQEEILKKFLKMKF